MPSAFRQFGTREKVNPPGLGPGDNPERYRGARPLSFQRSVRVARWPVKPLVLVRVQALEPLFGLER